MPLSLRVNDKGSVITLPHRRRVATACNLINFVQCFVRVCARHVVRTNKWSEKNSFAFCYTHQTTTTSSSDSKLRTVPTCPSPPSCLPHCRGSATQMCDVGSCVQSVHKVSRAQFVRTFQSTPRITLAPTPYSTMLDSIRADDALDNDVAPSAGPEDGRSAPGCCVSSARALLLAPILVFKTDGTLFR